MQRRDKVLEQLKGKHTVERCIGKRQALIDVRLHHLEATGTSKLDVGRAQVGARVRELEPLLARDDCEPASLRADVEYALAGMELGRSDRLAKAEQRLRIALRLLGRALVVELFQAVGRVRAAMLAA